MATWEKLFVCAKGTTLGAAKVKDVCILKGVGLVNSFEVMRSSDSNL